MVVFIFLFCSTSVWSIEHEIGRIRRLLNDVSQDSIFLQYNRTFDSLNWTQRTPAFAADHTSGFRYVYTHNSCTRRTHKGFKGTVVNRALPSLHEGSLEIALTVPLNMTVFRLSLNFVYQNIYLEIK